MNILITVNVASVLRRIRVLLRKNFSNKDNPVEKLAFRVVISYVRCQQLLITIGRERISYNQLELHQLHQYFRYLSQYLVRSMRHGNVSFNEH